MSYLHVLNLDTIGGVEELFVHFLVHAKKLSSKKQNVLVTSNRPHPFFEERLKIADSLILEKFLGPIKLPSFARSWKRKHALKAADTTILWNRMENYPWPKSAIGNVIYYEHGASWIAQKDSFKL